MKIASTIITSIFLMLTAIVIGGVICFVIGSFQDGVIGFIKKLQEIFSNPDEITAVKFFLMYL